MDFETVIPFTSKPICPLCKGQGVIFTSNGQEYDSEPCDCQVD